MNFPSESKESKGSATIRLPRCIQHHEEQCKGKGKGAKTGNQAFHLGSMQSRSMQDFAEPLTMGRLGELHDLEKQSTPQSTLIKYSRSET